MMNPPPPFIILTKLPESSASLLDVGNAEGNSFLTKEDRDDYILDYYKSV